MAIYDWKIFILSCVYIEEHQKIKLEGYFDLYLQEIKKKHSEM